MEGPLRTEGTHSTPATSRVDVVNHRLRNQFYELQRPGVKKLHILPLHRYGTQKTEQSKLVIYSIMYKSFWSYYGLGVFCKLWILNNNNNSTYPVSHTLTPERYITSSFPRLTLLFSGRNGVPYPTILV